MSPDAKNRGKKTTVPPGASMQTPPIQPRSAGAGGPTPRWPGGRTACHGPSESLPRARGKNGGKEGKSVANSAFPRRRHERPRRNPAA